MFVGLDFGTSQCAVTAATRNGLVTVPLEAQQPFLTSCIYTPERCLISDFVAASAQGDKTEFKQSRHIALQLATEVKRSLSINNSREALLFGADAMAQHMADPTEGVFIKSPKSFLGASGLRGDMVNFFEDVVTAMLLEIKYRAESYLQTSITGAVIGRPVNFQGIDTEGSNRQAQGILTSAASRAGFAQVKFLYEPLAAGLDFERSLNDNKTVLVVDIGGGTTDCSVVRMGPDHINKSQRHDDFLAHTGERIGGNDFDISLTRAALMPHYGMNSLLKNNLPMPIMPFTQASAVNDVAAQTAFYSDKMRLTLEQLSRDTTEPNILQRFISLRENKQNFALVRKAELAKIALSEFSSADVNLNAYTPGLAVNIQHSQLVAASGALLDKILYLIHEAIKSAQQTPDLVYLTGGSARSRFLKDGITFYLGASIPLLEGDHFGSVVNGLGVWAAKNKTPA
ncbi:MAG TPA: molecular chaperone [Cellvibrionaceae bacterium]|nr:molecular chaperone [Cellvibrionaceae bacterium]